MHVQRLQAIRRQQQYHLLPIEPGMMLEIHEKIGEGNNQRIWKFKGLVLKVRKPGHAEGSFTLRGKTAGHTIEKIYPLSFPSFDHVYLLDQYKIARAKLYYIRDKIGKDAKMKSKISAAERGLDLVSIAKEKADQEAPVQAVAAVQEEMVDETPTTQEVISADVAEPTPSEADEPVAPEVPTPEHGDDQGEATPDQVASVPEQTDATPESAPAQEETPEPLPEQTVSEDPNQETPAHTGKLIT